MIPKYIIVHHLRVLLHSLLGGIVSILNFSEGKDVNLAVVDHLVGNLDKEVSHSVISVIVSGDCVDHLNAIH